MLARRRIWLYQTHDCLLAKRIEFARPMTKEQVKKVVLTRYKKIVTDMWPTR